MANMLRKLRRNIARSGNQTRVRRSKARRRIARLNELTKDQVLAERRPVA